MSSSMFLKRKLTRDEDDDDRRDYAPAKHFKLTSSSPDSNDMAMSDAGIFQSPPTVPLLLAFTSSTAPIPPPSIMSSSMFLKRKLTRDDDDDDRRDYAPAKHFKLTSSSPDSNDMAMSDAGMNVVPFPTFATTSPHLSIATSPSSDGSPNYSLSSLPSASPLSAYPAFELYPEVESPMDVDMEGPLSTHHHSSSISSINSTSSSSPTMATGLLQPVTALQHGGNCTSLPRLRMSSHKGIHGTRTLWSHCESCGAIEMVSA